MQAVL
jgi:hypothetical protein